MICKVIAHIRGGLFTEQRPPLLEILIAMDSIKSI